jgi:hypothetical protein
MRLALVVSVLAVLAVVSVVVVRGGILGFETGDTTAQGTAFTATWALGCPSRSLGPNMCDPNRLDGSSIFCRLNSDGSSSSSNFAYKCGGNGVICSCNNQGSNNFRCITEGVLSFEGCQRCSDACDNPNYCGPLHDCVTPTAGLCSGTAKCESSDRCYRNSGWSSCQKDVASHECGNAPGTQQRDERRCYDGTSGSCTTRSATQICTVALGGCPSGYTCESNRCVAPPPSGCTRDSDCPGIWDCTGSCVVSDPYCTAWECGYVCLSGSCVQSCDSPQCIVGVDCSFCGPQNDLCCSQPKPSASSCAGNPWYCHCGGWLC